MSHKEDLPEKETPESAPDRPLLDFSDAAVKKAPPHRQETRLGPPRVCGGGPANQVRLVQLAQVAARRRARDIGAVSKLSGRQRLAAHKGVKHRLGRCRPPEPPLPPDLQPRPSLILSLLAEAFQSTSVRHRSNCSRKTIGNLAARMRCNLSREYDPPSVKRYVDPYS